MSAHTPGPWTIDKPVRGYLASITAPSPQFEESHVGIADVPDGIREGEQEANARLIAAAPDLLEALVGVLTRLEGLGISSAWPDFDVARAAIAKAEGR